MSNNTSETAMDVKVRMAQQEIVEIKKDVRKVMGEVDDIQGERKLILHRLDELQTTVGNIQLSINKDSGWREFFLDFIKAAAQVAALIGAGKFIF